jgi:WD40 repeat protein/serine/threonine protein kinase
LNHPSDESLRALSLGQLREAELAEVSAHLGDCPACCSRIDEQATDDRLVMRLQQGAATRDKALVPSAQRRSAVRALDRSHETTRNREGETAAMMLPVPRQIGDYDILAEVGRGGMGVVYKARHRGLHRLTALKMVLAGEFASPTQELRFRLEAELAARVRHPNIVQVYEIGSYEGRPFLALEWVEGGSLANRLDGKPWPPGEAAALIETLARAMDVAHAEGIVHRDLKPANILMSGEGRGARGEKKREIRDLTNGVEKSEGPMSEAGKNLEPDSLVPRPSPLATPKITDFGLAQTIEGGQTMTQSGFLVGTPGYMAPEQASGKRALIGPATDIHALGVVLYLLLTGQLPFQRDSTLELLRAVTSDEPPRPRCMQPRLPRDLEAITLHCLEKEPGSRYPSALALAEDLRRFQEGKQVVARPVGRVARLVRACRRRPLVTTLLVFLALSLIGGASGIAWNWLEANGQRDLANAEARQAEKEKQAALYQSYRASLAAASAALQNHDVADADRLLKLTPEGLRGWEWRHLHSRLDDSSAAVPFPAGGFLFAGPEQFQIGVRTSAGLRILDLEGNQLRTVPIPAGHQRSVGVSPTRRGLRVAAWIDETAFDLLDESGQVLCRVTLPENKGQEPSGAHVSPDGARLICTRVDPKGSNRIAVFDATSGKQTALCIGNGSNIVTMTFSPDGSLIAAANGDQTARVWEAATGKLWAACGGHTNSIHSVAFSPDSARLVTASADGTVRQWDTRTGQEVEHPYERHGASVHSAVYSPDGRWVASGGEDRTIRVWQATGRQEVAVLHGHTAYVAAVAFAPAGRQLASLSTNWGGTPGDNTVRIWDLGPDSALPVLRGHTSYVYPVAFSPDGRWLASGSWDKTARLWDAATGAPCAVLTHHSDVEGLAFGPDGTWLMTVCNNDDRLRVWDVATAHVLREIRCDIRHNPSMTVSPDGARVAVGDYAYGPNTWRMRVFDMASDKTLFTSEAQALAYSPDGRWLAAAAADAKAVLLLDARTHETVAQFSGHESRVFKAAFSPDSRCLATCSQDRTVRLWQIGTGECRVLRGHTDVVYAVAFHPDGTRLATAARDGAVWLWDVARGEELVRLRGHTGYVWSLAFSPNGATLASGSEDKTVRLWDTSPLKTRYPPRRAPAALRPETKR